MTSNDDVNTALVNAPNVSGQPVSSKYTLCKEIGKGSFGVALLAYRKSDNQQVVNKQIRIKELSDRERQEAINEVQLLSQFSHVNIIQYHECIVEVCLSYLQFCMRARWPRWPSELQPCLLPVTTSFYNSNMEKQPAACYALSFAM